MLHPFTEFVLEICIVVVAVGALLIYLMPLLAFLWIPIPTRSQLIDKAVEDSIEFEKRYDQRMREMGRGDEFEDEKERREWERDDARLEALIKDIERYIDDDEIKPRRRRVRKVRRSRRTE